MQRMKLWIFCIKESHMKVLWMDAMVHLIWQWWSPRLLQAALFHLPLGVVGIELGVVRVPATCSALEPRSWAAKSEWRLSL